MLATLTNGMARSGYILDDASFGVHVRGSVIAVAARMCRIVHRQRDPGPVTSQNWIDEAVT